MIGMFLADMEGKQFISNLNDELRGMLYTFQDTQERLFHFRLNGSSAEMQKANKEFFEATDTLVRYLQGKGLGKQS